MHRALLSLFAGLSLAAAALAQPGPGPQPIPDNLLAAASLSPADQAQVRAYADALFPALANTDPAVSQAARDRLIEPLRRDVSIAFRLAYSEALARPLRGLLAQPDDRIAFNALRILGVIATQASVDAVREALADQRASVRYGAAFAARRILDEAAAGRSPLNAEQVGVLVRALADRLATEPEAGVVGGIVAAFEAVQPAQRPAAITAMAAGLGAQAASFARADRNGSAEQWAAAFQRGVRAAQAAYLQTLRAGERPSPEFSSAVAQMSGRMLAHALRRLENGPSAAEAAALQGLVADSEGTLIFVHNEATSDRVEEQALRRAFETGNTGSFRDEAMKWIGPSGRLTKAPYNLAAPSFNAGG